MNFFLFPALFENNRKCLLNLDFKLKRRLSIERIIMPSFSHQQILFLFTNDTSSLHGQARLRHGKLEVEAKKLKKELGVKIVPIAIGDAASVDDLRDIASIPERAISCGVTEDPSKLGRKLLRGWSMLLNPC